MSPILRVVALLPLGGCSFYSYGFNNAFHDISKCSNDRKEIAHHQAQARKAWQALNSEFGKRSVDYRDGFLSGYESYLYAGERSAISSLPARYYTSHEYQSQNGQAAVQDWIAGFKHGMQDARHSGQRHFVIVPISSDASIEAANPSCITHNAAESPVNAATVRTKQHVEEKSRQAATKSQKPEQSSDPVAVLRPPPMR